MTDDKREMVTIEVPLDVLSHYAYGEAVSGDYGVIQQAAQKALDARKSKYERWRDSHGEGSMSGTDERRINSAKIQVIDALVAMHGCGMRCTCSSKDSGGLSRGCHDVRVEAIRKALPEDVAGEVLGE